ncbi:hypothetical protein CFOL_v3_19306 [Cephalotus follicularis]|uniref:Uncharacterized protein n=1 Tax=Cephalotus follicularis TaxID=3775 RepID=A0A1Q3C6J1_CEPFO|nr:hypothetical protein CFOL_v3_19306 [Cephalotus follicularis]
MKRKKWSELEEQTLLTKYSDLLHSGTLSKLKTREKKFRPIADHVNTVHHLQDPTTFPFKWSWRDVSIKVQNMRHQYLGVKQKIRVSEDEFNWKDGENHWENFLKYKDVFGDIELEPKGSSNKKFTAGDDGGLFEDCCDLGFGIDCEEENGDVDGDGGDSDGDGESESEFGVVKGNGEMGILRGWKSKKGFGFLASQILDLRSVVVGREEKRREREFMREKDEMERAEKRRKMELEKERRGFERDEEMDSRELELEERELAWVRRETERVRFERELDEERRRRRMVEEKREEEEMEWRERMMGLQIEHEKAIMQMQASACQNQMQILGVMTRLVCQFFGTGNDGLGGGLGALTPQVLQNLHHPGGLGDNVKPDSNSPSEFI